ncbi:MAG: twin-arginine translocase TatA/TatE family subunit [Myxococcaceae bacterium]
MSHYVLMAGPFNLGAGEMIIIFAILLLLFGGAKLPQLGSSLGSAIRNFKKGFSGEEDKAGTDGAPQGQMNSGNTVSSADKAKDTTKA